MAQLLEVYHVLLLRSLDRGTQHESQRRDFGSASDSLSSDPHALTWYLGAKSPTIVFLCTGHRIFRGVPITLMKIQSTGVYL
jgi:hypothetical protein